MTQYLIMCRSLTHAQRSAQVLERHGITAVVTKAPQGLSDRGCAYAVSLRRRQAEAVELLKEMNMLAGKVFEQQSGGEYREVRV